MSAFDHHKKAPAPSALTAGVLATASSLVLLAVSGRATAQLVDFDARMTGFYEPSSSSGLTVLNPGVELQVKPAPWLGIRGGYEADIVSGATESVKAGPLSGVDVVSSATDFDDTRHQFGGGISLTRDETELSANYSQGSESDYRSKAVSVVAATDFLQRNTRISLSYAHGFDTVCTSGYQETDAPSSRLALDSSSGCFGADSENRDERELALDNFQLAWTQNWTPVLSTQVALSAALQHGFLENPYRSVVIAPAGDSALEHHPENRARGALSIRTKYYIRGIATALTLGMRGYRDTWDVLSQSYELSAERHIVSWLRLLARGRFYAQSGALFFSDDYTGGEPETGPRGQYWTGDRELSSLKSYAVGGRFVAEHRGEGGERLLGVATALRGTAALDFIKTDLAEFTWGGLEPDDTTIFLLTLGLGASF